MTLIRIALFKSDASGVDIPANVWLNWAPSKRRHVEDPDDHIVLPAPFKVKTGADFLDEDGVVVTAGEPGIAWVEVDPTDVPNWAWTVWERTNEGRGTTWVEVPDVALVDYADLVVIDPDTMDPDEDATAAWYTTLNNRVPLTGTTGHVLTKGAGATNTWSAGGGGGGGAVDSVNGDAGPDVVLDAADVGAATAAQGATADTAVQPGDLAPVATSGDYDDLTDKPSALPPSGGAGGVLGGTYPNPSFAVDMAEQSELNAHTSNTSNPHSVTKTQVGLGSVDDTADTAKPVSTAQQTALNLKANTASLATVATSGDYDDLTDKPTIPAQVNLIEGANIDITGSYPNLTIAGTGGGGGGAVDSVNGDTGPAVVLDADDIDDTSTTNKYVTAADLTKLGNLSGTNTGDQDLSTLVPKTTTINGNALSSNVTLDADDIADGTTNHAFTAADDTKLAGIEALADVTDATNVAAAGAYVAGGTDVPVADGGTGRSTATTAYGLIAAGTTASGVQQTVTPGTSGHLLKSNGAAALASFSVGAPADVALGNVDNTSDANKPVSTATQTALDLQAPLASPAFTGTPTGITKTHVGLGNVDNTTDLAKPISTATQTALDLKADAADPNLPVYAQGLGLTGTFDAQTCLYNAKSTNLRPFNNGAALALRRTRPFRGIALGDSMTVGTDGAVASKQNQAIGSWFKRGLAKALGLPDAGGFCPVYAAPVLRGDRWGATGTVAFSDGWATMTAAATLTYTPLHPGTNVDISYDGTSPAFNYQILPGGSSTGITPTGAAGTETTTVAVPGGTLGFYTVVITAATTGTKILGADMRRTTGVHMDNIGLGGSSADWEPATGNAWVAGSYMAGRRGWLDDLAFDPDFVWINLGSNDMFQGGTYPNNGDTAAHAIAGLNTMCGWFPNSTILLTQVWEVDSGAFQTNLTKFDDYVGQKYELADTLDIPLLDFRWRSGYPVSVTQAEDAVIDSVDGIHMPFGAQEEWGRHMLRCLYPHPAIEVAVQPSGGPFAHLPDEALLEEYTV